MGSNCDLVLVIVDSLFILFFSIIFYLCEWKASCEFCLFRDPSAYLIFSGLGMLSKGFFLKGAGLTVTESGRPNSVWKSSLLIYISDTYSHLLLEAYLRISHFRCHCCLSFISQNTGYYFFRVW